MADTIADTSALQYLHQLGLLDVLEKLAGRLVVPAAVADELETGIRLGKNLPSPSKYRWMSIVIPLQVTVLQHYRDLGPAETQVLMLALERPGAVAILDDHLARVVATSLGVKRTGVLGVLLQARRAGLIPAIRPLLDRLQILGFRVSKTTRAEVLEMAGE